MIHRLGWILARNALARTLAGSFRFNFVRQTKTARGFEVPRRHAHTAMAGWQTEEREGRCGVCGMLVWLFHAHRKNAAKRALARSGPPCLLPRRSRPMPMMVRVLRALTKHDGRWENEGGGDGTFAS